MDYILAKYEEPYFYGIEEVGDYEKRLNMLLDALFGLDRVRFVDDGAFYSCYSLTFRNPEILDQFKRMYERFRTLLIRELTLCKDEGVIGAVDVTGAANAIMSLVEGLGYFEQMLDARRYGELCRNTRQMARRFLAG